MSEKGTREFDVNGKPINAPQPKIIDLAKLVAMNISDDDLMIASMAFILDYNLLCMEIVNGSKSNENKVDPETLKKVKQLYNTCQALLVPILSDKVSKAICEKFEINDDLDEDGAPLLSESERAQIIVKKTREYTTELLKKIIEEASEGAKDGK